MITRYSLLQNWEFKLNAAKKRVTFLPIKISSWQKASVPGTIHTDLLKNKIISDPFSADNEEKIKWITQSNWQYQTRFDLPRDFESDKPIDLIFKGLDTFAEVSLNGRLIGHSDNMFRSFHWDVHAYLKPTNNILKVVFKNPFEIYARIHHEKRDNFNLNWEPRVYLRKAQYSFGWDWGPAFPTMGIWRPVYLEQHLGIKIRAVRSATTGIQNNHASLKILVDCEGESGRISAVKIRLSNRQSQYEHLLPANGQLRYRSEFEISDPLLWWPNGMGKANLYDLQVEVFGKDGEVVDVWQKKVGIRTLELKLEEEGKPVFQFKINGKAVYIKGADWIPADSFLPRVTEQVYQKLLTMAKFAHMNMIRVWGGGIYENDSFYEICDALGLMVWQDFMFACSEYPEYPEFIENVRKEISENVLRLQHHPCLAIWCGNNENEWIWQRGGHHPLEAMSGYSIYHHLIPSMLQELDPDRPYWPSSPFGDGPDPNDTSTGNRHQWEIWSFWTDYTQVKHDKSLFVTEFGFQAPANRSTLESVIPPESRHPQSELFEYHNKQIEGNERLFRYLAGHLPVSADWADFIYLTQLNQGFALKTCIEYWRGRWPETSGSIIWQLNDCWPVSSWSLIDSRLTPKLSYFFVKQAFSPAWISFGQSKEKVGIYLDTEIKFTGMLQISVFQLSNGKKLSEHHYKIGERFQNKKKWDVRIPDLQEKHNWIITTSLYNKAGNLLYRNYYTPARWKHARIANAGIKIINKKNILTITCSKPAYFVDLYHPRICFEERGFILLPGEEKKIKNPEGVSEKEIQVFTLNSYLVP